MRKLALFLLLSGLLQFHSQSEEKSLEQNTEVSAHSEVIIKSGRNYVWCPTFQLAWDSIERDMLKGKAQFDKKSTLVEKLNRSTYELENLDPATYFSKVAVISPDGVLRPDLEKEFIAKFGRKGNEAIIKDIREMKPQTPLGFVVLSYLEKYLAFKTPLPVFKTPLRFKASASGRVNKAVAFGFVSTATKYKSNDQYEGIVSVLDYEDEDNFIISLGANRVKREKYKELPKNPDLMERFELDESIEVEETNGEKSDDSIILAKITPNETLEQTWDAVEKRIANFKGEKNLRSDEIVKIPRLHLNIEKEYESLHGLICQNPNFTGYELDRTLQVIKFNLTEKGADLRSHAAIRYYGSARMRKIDYAIPTRRFVFDGPFLMALRESGKKKPYLLVWVGNGELMEKWRSKADEIDYFSMGEKEAAADLSKGLKQYLVDGKILQDGGIPNNLQELRQYVMNRCFALQAVKPPSDLPDYAIDDYVRGYNEKAFSQIAGASSIAELIAKREALVKKACANSAKFPSNRTALLWDLKDLQNEVGSWGEKKEKQVVLTSMATLLFLAHGETPASPNFGTTVLKGFRKLLVFADSNWKDLTPSEKDYLTLAISEAANLTKIPILTKTTEKIGKSLLDSPPRLSIWRTLALFSLELGGTIAKEQIVASAEKTLAAFPEKEGETRNTELARMLMKRLLLNKNVDRKVLEKMVESPERDWDALTNLDEFDAIFASMMIIWQAPNNKKLWKEIIRYQRRLTKRQKITGDYLDDEIHIFFPFTFKSGEKPTADQQLYANIVIQLCPFIYYRYLKIFKLLSPKKKKTVIPKDKKKEDLGLKIE